MPYHAPPRPVTRASKELARVRAGTMTWEDLVKRWAARRFEPVPKPKTIEEVWSMGDGNRVRGAPGTWEEILDMYGRGDLSEDEYRTVLRAKIAHSAALDAKRRPFKYYTVGEPPVMLVRLSWPRTQQFITPTNPVWTDNRNLAELEWDSSGDICERDEATKIAKSWGAEL
jgi:hypothetical protein